LRGAMAEQVDSAKPLLLRACEVSAGSTRWPRYCACRHAVEVMDTISHREVVAYRFEVEV